MKPRVVIGMSGGVDSSVAAYKLHEDGWDVIGVTMKLWPQECMSRAEDQCCGPQAIIDARTVAQQIGIPHYVLDEQAAFQKQVIDYFIAEYRAARTPNPCVLCNDKLKFGSLLDKARELGATHIATGHYAVVDQEQGRWRLRKGGEPKKDQSYFLFTLSQAQLEHTLFPLGTMAKQQTRAVATKLGLKVADKQESQEICFVTENDYRLFLREQGIASHEGEIVDRQGRVLGRHSGVEFFTIGQRRGLGIATGRPMYVVALDPSTNRVVVGEDDALCSSACIVDRCNWVSIPTLSTPLEVAVKIRSQHGGSRAIIEPLDPTASRVRVRFAEPERAVTPGQAAVFYEGDLLLGGGWISQSDFEQPSTADQSQNSLSSNLK